MTGAALAQAARALVGAPYHPGGRDPATGLDCLGVLAAALAAIGARAGVPPRGTQRRNALPEADRIAQAAGLVDATGPIVAGDVVLVHCAPIQPHLLIAVDPNSYVHAHAALRRVVMGPRDPSWLLSRHWRLQSNIED